MNKTLVKPYKKDSAGKLMKTEFITVQKYFTVDEAIAYFRMTVNNKKNIHYIYAVNQDHVLRGVVSMKELLAAEGHERINKIMVKDVTSVNTDLDQEDVAKIVEDKDLLSVPVVDEEHRMAGVVHVDDILDVVQKENTEDFHKMAPVVSLGTSLKKASVGLLYRKRIAWLLVLVFMNVFSGAGIAAFEDTIAASIVLVFFLPLLVDSGGNAGSQAATLMIRSMALGDVKIKDWLKLFTKEISVSFFLGLTMAAGVALLGAYKGGTEIAIIVALTMVLVVMLGSLIGMSLPFILNKLKMDPATASAPLITSIADICGVLIYFSIATWFLGL